MNDKKQKKQNDKTDNRTTERIAQCDLVIGYDITNGDVFVIKDKSGGTMGLVQYEHALKRLALAHLRAEVEYEMNGEEVGE